MADSGSSSANTAILAIFVVVVLFLIGFFVVRGIGVGGKKTEIEISAPKIPTPGPESTTWIRGF